MLGGGRGGSASGVTGRVGGRLGRLDQGLAVRWRIAAALLVVASGAPLLPKILAFVQGADVGWDLRVVCSSLDALRAGVDPYRHSQPFPLPYPVLHLYLVAPLCAIGAAPFVYGPVFVLIAAASAVMLWRVVPATTTDRIAVVAAVALGLHGFPWQVATGNVAVVELPLAAATVCLLATRRFRWAGAVFGAMASLKILPLVGAIAFVFVPASNRRRLEAFAAAVGCFLSIHVVNAVVFARWLPSYVHQLAGRVPGGAGYESGGLYNQDVVDLVASMLGLLGLGGPVIGFALAVLGLGAGWLVAVVLSDDRGRDGMGPAARASVVILVVWLFLFRQKPYAFATFVPFLIAAGYGAGRTVATTTIVTSIVVPAALRNGFWQVPVLGAYYQLLGAWAAVAVLAVGLRLGWAGERGNVAPRRDSHDATPSGA